MPEQLVFGKGYARVLLGLEETDLLRGDIGSRLLHPVLVVGVVDAEENLPFLDPTTALVGGVDPFDLAGDLRRDVDFGSRPDGSGPVHGNCPGRGHRRRGGDEGNPGRRFTQRGLGPHPDHDRGDRHGADQDACGDQHALGATHLLAPFGA